jgi:hypothetical protein
MRFVPQACLMTVLAMSLGCSSGIPGEVPPFEPEPIPESGDVPSAHGEVIYDFVARSDGLVVTEGTIVLKFPEATDELYDPNGVTGSWDLQVVRSLPNLGFRSGTGTLAGNLNRNNVTYLDLVPLIADDDVVLRGAFDENGDLSGGWLFATIVGQVRAGSFTATAR